jgi:hypothetical protein
MLVTGAPPKEIQLRIEVGLRFVGDVSEDLLGGAGIMSAAMIILR